MKKFLTSSLVVIAALTTLPFFVVHAAGTGFGSSSSSAQTVSTEGTYERAIVEQVTLRGEKTENGEQQVQVYKIRFLSGPLKNQEREIVNEIDSNPYRLNVREGDTMVILLQTNEDGSLALYVDGFDRRWAIFWLLILFVGTLAILSGWQGIKVAASIGISVLLIGYVLIPSFLKGVNPVPMAILLGGVLVLISTTFSTGWNKKSFITVIGTVGGALVAYVISLIFANWSHLNGLSSEDDRLFFNNNPNLNPQGLLFAGIIIASVGVVEDVAVSIASGVWEVKRANPRMSFADLFRSGMTIGNDHMGALANTLVFAYVGGSLSSLLLFKQFGSSWIKFINFDTVVDEILRSLSGTIGLAFTVPITALLAAWVMRHVPRAELESEPVTHHHHHHS